MNTPTPTKLCECLGASPMVEQCFVVFTLQAKQLKVLCEPPTTSPEKPLALPQKRLNLGSAVGESAAAALHEITGEEGVFHEQFQVYGGGDDRLPLTIGYYALVSPVLERQPPLHWCSVTELPELSAHHKKLVQNALQTLRIGALHFPLAFHLLPPKFTLMALQEAYEGVLGVQYGKSNFRRKVTHMPFLVPCQEWQQGVAHRAAQLYEFDQELYHALCAQGFSYSF